MKRGDKYQGWDLGEEERQWRVFLQGASKRKAKRPKRKGTKGKSWGGCEKVPKEVPQLDS